MKLWNYLATRYRVWRWMRKYGHDIEEVKELEEVFAREVLSKWRKDVQAKDLPPELQLAMRDVLKQLEEWIRVRDGVRYYEGKLPFETAYMSGYTGDGFYFWDESATSLFGPYESVRKATEMAIEYAHGLNTTGQGR